MRPFGYAARNGARSALVKGVKPKPRRIRFSAANDSLAGAVISIPIGLPASKEEFERKKAEAERPSQDQQEADADGG